VLVAQMRDGPASKELQRLFRYYCSHGERQPSNELSSQKFLKLCGDARLIDGQFNNGVVNIVFLQAIRSVDSQRRSRMSWQHFLLGVAMSACRKFSLYTPSEALQIVLDNHLLPMAAQMKASSEPQELQETNPEVQELFEGARPMLQGLFMQRAGSQGRGPVPRTEGGAVLQSPQLTQLSEDLGIVPQHLSMPQALRVVNELKFWSRVDGEQMAFAPRLGGSAANSPPSHRVRLLLDSLYALQGPAAGTPALALGARAARPPDGSASTAGPDPTAPSREEVEALVDRFCSLHDLDGATSRFLAIYEHYGHLPYGLQRGDFMRLISDCQLVDQDMPEKQVETIFNTAVHSKAEEVSMGMQQLLDALCMLAHQKFADASDRVAGTQFLMENYILAYAAGQTGI